MYEEDGRVLERDLEGLDERVDDHGSLVQVALVYLRL